MILDRMMDRLGRKSLRPIARPNEIGSYRGSVWFPRREAGIYVSEETALLSATVFRCIYVIASTMGALVWRQHKRLAGGGSKVMDDFATDWVLHRQFNPEMTAIVGVQTLAGHVVSWGNGYAEIERDQQNKFTWLWPITPDRVCPKRDENDQIYYEVSNGTGGRRIIKPNDMFHVSGLGFDGVQGYSVLAYAARAIGLSLAAESNSSSFFGNNSQPLGFLSPSGPMSDEQINAAILKWEARNKGPQNRGKMNILPFGMKFENMSIPNNDAQMIETRQFQPLDICRFFGVPPHKVFEMGRATWNNIEAAERDFAIGTLLPWCTRFEQEANLKLIPVREQGRKFTKFNLKVLLRGDVTAQTAHYRTMNDIGVYSVNEIREMEDLAPIGPDGDVRFVQVNRAPLDKAVEGDMGNGPAPESEPEPETPEKKPQPEAEEKPPDAMSIVRPLLLDAAQRLVRKCQNASIDLVGKESPEYLGCALAFKIANLFQEYVGFGPAFETLKKLVPSTKIPSEWWECTHDVQVEMARDARALKVPTHRGALALFESARAEMLVAAIEGALNGN